MRCNNRERAEMAQTIENGVTIYVMSAFECKPNVSGESTIGK